MNNLKKYRKASKLTQKELAKILGIGTDYLSVIETGKRTPSLKLAKDIADCFLTTIDELNFFNEPSNKLFVEAS
jgi:putative transcriptional regulator